MSRLRLPAGQDSSEAEKAQTRVAFDNLLAVFETSLRLLSPFMPFLTEELWHALYDGKTPKKSIALASYPQADAGLLDAAPHPQIPLLHALTVNLHKLPA